MCLDYVNFKKISILPPAPKGEFRDPKGELESQNFWQKVQTKTGISKGIGEGWGGSN